jgi:hypothetical protein
VRSIGVLSALIVGNRSVPEITHEFAYMLPSFRVITHVHISVAVRSIKHPVHQIMMVIPMNLGFRSTARHLVERQAVHLDLQRIVSIWCRSQLDLIVCVNVTLRLLDVLAPRTADPVHLDTVFWIDARDNAGTVGERGISNCVNAVFERISAGALPDRDSAEGGGAIEKQILAVCRFFLRLVEIVEKYLRRQKVLLGVRVLEQSPIKSLQLPGSHLRNPVKVYHLQNFLSGIAD